MTGELFLDDQRCSGRDCGNPGLESEVTDGAALAKSLESLRTSARVDVARAAARSLMRNHDELMRAGRVTDAERAAAEAESMSDPDRTPDVELGLAARAAAIGGSANAERRYRGLLAALGDESALGAVAAFRLAHILIERGERGEAITLWERALLGADENLRPHVLVELAGGLRSCGRRDDAERLYAQAIATDHPDLAPQAALTLGGLREEAGHNADALELYALVAASQHPDHASDAEVRHGALMHRRTRSAIQQMLLIELKQECDALPDDEPDECLNEPGEARTSSALPAWCRQPHVERARPHDVAKRRRLASYERLLTRLLDNDGGLGLSAMTSRQPTQGAESGPGAPIAAGAHIVDADTAHAAYRGLDFVVIMATCIGVADGHWADADRERETTFLSANDSRSCETARAALPNLPDRIRGVSPARRLFADRRIDIDVVKSFVVCHFSANHQSPLGAVVVSGGVGLGGGPNVLVDAHTVAIALCDTSATVKEIDRKRATSRDHLLLGHVTHALAAVRCKDALITGALSAWVATCRTLWATSTRGPRGGAPFAKP
jgi:tetratricopeptide (TPR) repeat protein